MHVILRLAVIPVGLLYGYIAATTGNWGASLMAALLLLCFATLVVRGLVEDMEPIEAAVLSGALPASLLATIPYFAIFASPGLCTDMSLHYEISLVASIYLGSALVAQLLSKAIKPFEQVRLSSTNERLISQLQRYAPVLPLGFLLLALPPAVTLVWEGACAANATHVVAIPALTLPPLALLVLFGSSALRRHTTRGRP